MTAKSALIFSKPLTETACAVLIGVILAVGGLIGFTAATTEIRLQRTVTQIVLITGRLRLFFAEHPMRPLSFDELAGAGVLGKDDYDGGKTFHPFSEPTDLNGVTFFFSSGKNFTVTWRRLPKRACLRIATYPFGHAVSHDLLRMTMTSNGKTAVFATKANAESDERPTVPLSYEEAQKNCGDATDIGWTYRP